MYSICQRLLEQNCAVKLELEVRPRFLVTDTNCFIDHLSSLRSIVAMATYTLVVPLVGQYSCTKCRINLGPGPFVVTMIVRPSCLSRIHMTVVEIRLMIIAIINVYI